MSPSGTWLWKLAADGTWTNVLRLSAATDTQADTKVVGNLVHVLLYGAAPELVSIEFVGGSYQPWSLRPTSTSVSLPNSEIATIDVDSTGRMWLATENGANINVHYSDAPYSSFSGPVTLATGVAADDIGEQIFDAKCIEDSLARLRGLVCQHGHARVARVAQRETKATHEHDRDSIRTPARARPHAGAGAAGRRGGRGP